MLPGSMTRIVEEAWADLEPFDPESVRVQEPDLGRANRHLDSIARCPVCSNLRQCWYDTCLAHDKNTDHPLAKAAKQKYSIHLRSHHER